MISPRGWCFVARGAYVMLEISAVSLRRSVGEIRLMCQADGHSVKVCLDWAGCTLWRLPSRPRPLGCGALEAGPWHGRAWYHIPCLVVPEGWTLLLIKPVHNNRHHIHDASSVHMWMTTKIDIDDLKKKIRIRMQIKFISENGKSIKMILDFSLYSLWGTSSRWG